MRKLLNIMALIVIGLLSLSFVSALDTTNVMVDSVRVNGDYITLDPATGNATETLAVEEGQTIEIRLGLQSTTGTTDVEDVRVTVIIYDLGIYRSTVRFDLDEGDDVNRGLALQIPEDALAGEYLVKVTASNQEHRESAYRLLQVS